MKKDYQILHIDPLGQGVAKSEDKITFIKKTLPGEVVEANILKTKKNIEFASLTKIVEPSKDRIEPSCPHFSSCNGCDFLHTKYENELIYKENALRKHLFKFPKYKLTIHPAVHRLNYRNRIQLHFDLSKAKMGMLNDKYEITPIPECQIAQYDVTKTLKDLYINNKWMNFVSRNSDGQTKGHVELYSHEGKVNFSVNKPYADGGFTQVFPEMNKRLISWVNEFAKKNIKPTEIVFDLFGGNGNITKDFIQKTLVVDIYNKIPLNNGHQTFLNQNLYSADAISAIKKAKFPSNVDWIIFDPPRSGLKNIKEYLDTFRPKGFIFIACDPTSFARDTLTALSDYKLEQVELFDLFPGTHHFETIGLFTKSHKGE